MASGGGVFPDESRVREVVEQIRARCALAQQLKHSGQLTSASGSLQFAQAEEVQKRLNETIFRLQEAVRDFSVGGVENRLRQIAQKLSLSFDKQVNSFFLSCDAFFVEINCHENGEVNVVKLVQGHNQQEESELFAHLLQEHQYAEFESHLHELTELYSHAGQDKIKFFLALSAMEKVLEKISESSPHAALGEMIMKNPVGHVTLRKGGHPMHLAYFVDPYEVHRLPVLRSMEQDATPPDGVAETGSILMENTTQQRVFRLPIENIFKPIPISAAVKEKLFRIGDQPIQPVTGPHVNELIAGKKAEKLLPGQRHYYFLQSPSSSSSSSSPSHSTSPDHISPSERGTMISNVHFTHPVQIFTIIPLLRKQLVYNTLLASCLKQNSESSTLPADHSVSEYMFHITTTPPDQIIVSMETLNSKEQQLTFVIVIPDQPHPTQPLVRVSVGEGRRTGHHFTSSTSTDFLEHPSILGEEAAVVLQNYEKEMAKFKQEIMAGGEPVEEGGLESVVGGEMIDLVIPVDGDNDGTSVVEELVYAGMKRKWTE